MLANIFGVLNLVFFAFYCAYACVVDVRSFTVQNKPLLSAYITAILLFAAQLLFTSETRTEVKLRPTLTNLLTAVIVAVIVFVLLALVTIFTQGAFGAGDTKLAPYLALQLCALGGANALVNALLFLPLTTLCTFLFVFYVNRQIRNQETTQQDLPFAPPLIFASWFALATF